MLYDVDEVVIMFKERLKQARTQIGYSQKKLGDALFVSQEAVSQYERGRITPSPEMVKKMAAVLGVSVGWLLEAEEASYSPEEIELINAYRRLDERGKRAVKALIASI